MILVAVKTANGNCQRIGIGRTTP